MSKMSTLNDEQSSALVESALQLARRGAFFALTKQFDLLERLASSRGDAIGVASRAILAETYDEVGMYHKAEAFVSRETGMEAVDKLKELITEPTPDRATVRSLTMLLLQCAVSQSRKETGQAHALQLLDEGIDLVATTPREGLFSKHFPILFYFWRGRIHTSQYEFEAAERDFQAALDMVDRNLEEKLGRSHQESQRAEHIAVGNYVLANCLGIGLGQLRQLQGKLADSLQFLRVAVPLSRGSVDFHRRGYAHLLIGIALRSRNGTNDFDLAYAHLSDAKKLFGGSERAEKSSNESECMPHHLNLARANYQLALSLYHRALISGSDRQTSLAAAEALDVKAETESNHDSCREHRDPVLDYGIQVVRSLIRTARGDYSQADDHAEKAIRIIKERRLPRWTHGWAWVAKGMASAERVQSRDQDREIRTAEDAFEKAFSDENVFATDRATAHLHLSRLYMRIGEPYKARFHYDRARPLVEQSEYGWIKDLALTTQEEIGTSLGFVCNFDLKDLLAAGVARGRPWEYITDYVTDELKRQLIRLKSEALLDHDGVATVARELGVSRATLYNWLATSDLNDFPQSRKGGRAKRTQRKRN